MILFIFFSQGKNAFISLRNELFPKILDIICWLLCIFKDVFEFVEVSFKEEVYSGVAYRQALWRKIEGFFKFRIKTTIFTPFVNFTPYSFQHIKLLQTCGNYKYAQYYFYVK